LKKLFFICATILLTLSLSTFSLSQAEEEGMLHAKKIKIALGFEYFSRKIGWDVTYSSNLRSLFFTLNLEIEFPKELSSNTIFGYSSANYQDLTFRELPFSLKIGEKSGAVKGFIIGEEIRKGLIASEKLKIDGLGQILGFLGLKKDWNIQGLALPGTAEGKAYWWRLSLGPVFTYRGFTSFFPYLYLNLNTLWGTFNMQEAIGEIQATERQKIYSKSFFCITPGLNYELTPAFIVKGEVNFLPYSGGTDLGLMIRAMYSF
jgi:hypothetical protein